MPLLARHLGVSHILATLLLRLGLREPAAAEKFLDAKLADLDDPFAVTGIVEAVARLRQALEAQEDVLVFGDYDVDGVTSTSLLSAVLGELGGKVRYAVPRRLDEGYGLTRAALERVLAEGPADLVVAVDCGTNSLTETAWLKERGCDVIVIDHHVCPDAALRSSAILVNPHVNDGEDRAWSQLCAVGLVFKVVHGLLKSLRQDNHPGGQLDLKRHLDLVALGTIADMVPLRGENRILARAGLRRLGDPARAGLRALYEVCGMVPGSGLQPHDISFKLGPRINASGRLADAATPIRLLLSEDDDFCKEVSLQLNDYNSERQRIEKTIFEQAERMVEETMLHRAGLVLHHPDWHAGVVGIVASRLVQKYHRPAIVLGAENGHAKGSGRSLAGLDLVKILQPCAHLLSRWGGHPMAVGVSADPAMIGALQDAFSDSVALALGGDIVPREIDISVWLRPADLGERLLTELERLHPFGQGNSEPIFGLRGLTLRQDIMLFGKEQEHFRFSLPTEPGQKVSFVAWKMAHRSPPRDQPIDMAIRLAWNSYNGRRHPQATIVDWRNSL